MNLPSISKLEEYHSICEAFLASNKENRLKKQQKEFLSGKRKEFNISLEESKIIEKSVKNKIVKKTGNAKA